VQQSYWVALLHQTSGGIHNRDLLPKELLPGNRLCADNLYRYKLK